MKTVKLLGIAAVAMMLCLPVMGQTEEELRKAIEIENLKKQLREAKGTLPCQEESFDDDKYYRDLGIGEAATAKLARNKAIEDAKGNIKRKLGEMVQRLSSDYLDSYEGDIANETQNRMRAIMIGVTNKAIDDAEKTCEYFDHNGKNAPRSYYALQIPKNKLKEEMTEALQEAKLGFDFEADQFQKLMDEKMEEL